MAHRLVGPTLALLFACSGPDDADSSQPATTSDPAPATTDGADDTTSSTTTAGATDGATDTGVVTTTADEPAAPHMPTMLPSPTGTCPQLTDGEVTFAPAGIEPRAVRLWMSDAAATMDGPLVFYWHGTGGSPQEATSHGLGADYVAQVVAQGGIIAAPVHDPAAGDFPWFLVLGDREDDLILADEVLACAIDQVGVDVRHIHTAGMSAGGLQTAQMSFRRSGYIASAAPYSGGIIAAPPDQEPQNPMAAMIFHGGEDDIVIIQFQQTSERYRDAINDRGGFAFICDHGGGHSIPKGAAQESLWRFFLDHPYGTKPSPYTDALPDGFPDYCTLP